MASYGDPYANPYGGGSYAPYQAYGQQAPAPTAPAYGYGYGQETQPQPQMQAMPAATYVPSKPGPPSYQGDEGQRFQEGKKYNDPFFAVLWILHLFVIFIVAIVLFGKYEGEMNRDEDEKKPDKAYCDAHPDDPDCKSVSIKLNAKFWGLMVIFIAGGAAVSAFWLYMIRRYGKGLIWFTLIFNAALLGVFTIMLFAAGAVAGGIIMLIFLGINLLYIYLVRRRIEFAAVMMEIVSYVLNLYPAPIYYSFASVLVQAVWMIIWVIAAASSMYALERDNASDGVRGIAYFFLLVSFFWTSQVVKNVIHVTTAGTFATWYFLYPAHMPASPTNKAFKRATTSSLGSICLGSLIIAAVKALRVMVQQGRNSENNFARACAEFLIRCLEWIIEYFNTYAFTQVAIYGKTYIEAAKATWQLLRQRGLDAIINDDIIGGALMLGALIGGLLLAVVGGLLAHYAMDMDNWGLYALIGFLIGFAMTVITMEVVESCVAALFVCYAEDPQALFSTKPDEYNKLTSAFTKFYGNVAPMLVARQ